MFVCRDDSSEPESKDGVNGEGRSRKESLASILPHTRGVLKRMHTVKSDEREPSTSTSPSGSSPLKTRGLLDSTDGGGKSAAQALMKRVLLSATQKQVPAPPEPEPEVIGAGLPLMQRLRLLRQKEERERKVQEERDAMRHSLLGASIEGNGSVHQTGLVTVEPPPRKVGTGPVAIVPGERIQGRLSARESVSSMDSGSSVSSPTSFSLLSGRVTFSPPLRRSTSPPSIATTSTTRTQMAEAFSDTLSTETSGSQTTVIEKPFSKAESSDIGTDSTTSPPSGSSNFSRSIPCHNRPGALRLRQKTYGSVDDLSPEFSRLPFVKKLQILNERQKIAQILMNKTSSSVLTRSTSEGSNESAAAHAEVYSRLLQPEIDTGLLHAVHLGRRTQSSREHNSREGLVDPSQSSGSGITGITFSSAQASPFYIGEAPSVVVNKCEEGPVSSSSIVSKPCAQIGKTAATSAIVCLRTAETESTTIVCTSEATSTVRTTITTIDSTSGGGSVASSGSNISKRRKSKKRRRSRCKGNNGATSSGSSNKLGTSSSGEESSAPSTESSSASSRLSPEHESNETPERRNLKSILKRLAESSPQGDAEGLRPNGTEDKGTDEANLLVKTQAEEAKSKSPSPTRRRHPREEQLLRAPTIEGYAARHRKFSKNVTFHRQTVNVSSSELERPEDEVKKVEQGDQHNADGDIQSKGTPLVATEEQASTEVRFLF